ncbi:MAG: hypothetical protein GX947_03845 [Tissierellia bacterium]|nr:hypothetical protein [Tissierellia bacterium]
MKNKNRSNTPRHKRLNRVSRLQAAKHWIPKYEGKNIVKGYSKHFGVDKLCAARELELIGYKIDTEYINNLKASIIERQKFAKRKNKVKEEKRLLEKYLEDECDYYITEYLDIELEEDCWDDEIPF